MLNNPFVFVVGAPRSGTTWVKSLIGSHEQVIMHNQELTIFNNYVLPFNKTWTEEIKPIELGKWNIGLPSIWNEKEKDQFIIEFIEKVYNKLGDIDGKVIMDKHPSYALCLEEIIKYIPNAKVIHVIRDARNMSLSMVDVNLRLGFGWNNTYNASLNWKKHVQAARNFGTNHPKSYLEIKYEEMINKPEYYYSDVLEFLQLPFDETFVESVIENNTFEKNKVSSPNDKLNYQERIKQDMWRRLSRRDRYQIQLAAGDLMMELNYIQDHNWWEESKFKRILFMLKHKTNAFFFRIRLATKMILKGRL